MSELTLFVLRFGFLALLWVFVFAIVFALRSDLFGHYVRRGERQQGAGAPRTAAPCVHARCSPHALPAATWS